MFLSAAQTPLPGVLTIQQHPDRTKRPRQVHALVRSLLIP